MLGANRGGGGGVKDKENGRWPLNRNNVNGIAINFTVEIRFKDRGKRGRRVKGSQVATV